MIKRWLASGIGGVLSGLAATLFLYSLKTITEWRNEITHLYLALPLIGLIIGWCYQNYGKQFEGGAKLIFSEIDQPKSYLNWLIAPFILISTLATHLFGGSAGREGTAIQMSATLFDQVIRHFKFNLQERKIILIASVGAGFGAAIGAPFAGVIFGIEAVGRGRLRPVALIESLIATSIAFGICQILGAPHSHFPEVTVSGINWLSVFAVATAGIIFGLVARFFLLLEKFVVSVFVKFISYPPFRPMIGGILLSIAFYFEGTHRYESLGISQIQLAFSQVSSFDLPLFKSAFTLLTLGTGFKGGEFIPLVFIGTTLGSALSVILPATNGVLAATGFGAVFGAASKAPLACSIMIVELFGPSLAIYALIACYISFMVSGTASVYRTAPSGASHARI